MDSETLNETLPHPGEPAAPGSRHERRVVAGVCVALVLACVAVYGRTLAHDFVNYDDPLYVTENAEVRAGLSWANIAWAFTTDRAMYMHPLTWISHMVDCEVYGLRPWGHHLTNLVLHAIDSVLLFLVCAGMTRRLWPSALVAALFAVHPLHVESVAWISERKDVLSMLFWTASLGAYAWYRRGPGLGRYLSVALLFLAALMSKPMVVTLPFVLLLLDYWPLERAGRAAPLGDAARRLTWLAVEKIPLFLMTLLFCVVTFAMQSRANNLSFGDEVPLVSRCANAAVVYVLYLAKTVWPSGLAAYYEHPITRPLWQVAGAVVILAAISVFCILRARRQPYLVVGWLWYLGTLVPVIELVQAGTFSHADRYTYIPLVGIFIMVAWGGADVAAAWRVPKRALAVGSGVMLAALTVCAGVQAGHWRDGETLFRHAIAAGHESAAAHNNLAVLAMSKGRRDEARNHLEKALALKPDYADALGNKGKLALDQGRNEEARACLTKALELRPNHVNVLNNLGVLETNEGRLEEARVCLTKALELKPRHVEALNNMGRLMLEQGRFDDAKTYLKKVLELKPDHASALNNLGWCAMSQAEYTEAEGYYRRAIAIDPQFVNAMNNLSLVLAMLGRPDEAAEYVKRASEAAQALAAGK
jgi:Tfp pilus assembly protein PilF